MTTETKQSVGRTSCLARRRTTAAPNSTKAAIRTNFHGISVKFSVQSGQVRQPGLRHPSSRLPAAARGPSIRPSSGRRRTGETAPAPRYTGQVKSIRCSWIRQAISMRTPTGTGPLILTRTVIRIKRCSSITILAHQRPRPAWTARLPPASARREPKPT